MFVEFALEEKMSCPLHRVVHEESMPLVQRIRRNENARVCKLPVPPIGFQDAIKM